MPLTDRTLSALRCTAAVLVAVPTVRARIRDDTRVVLEVRREEPVGELDHPVLPPCAFHRAVASAHKLRRAGEQLGFRGIPAGVEPAIEWGVGRGDLTRDGVIVRVTADRAWLHVAAAAVPLAVCRTAVEADDGGPPGLGYHADDELETTLLHLTTPIGDHVASAEVLDALHMATARVAVAELLDRIAAEVPDSPAFL